MVHTVSLVPLVWPKDTRNDVYQKSKYSMENQETKHMENKISQKCQQIVPTPHGNILQPPRASQVPYKTPPKNRRFSVYFPINSRSTTQWPVCYTYWGNPPAAYRGTGQPQIMNTVL